MTPPDGSTDPASILVVVPNLNVGGTERHLCQIMPRLNGPRHRITLCTLSEKGTLAPTLERQGVAVHELSSPGMGWPRMPRISRLYLLLRTGVALWRLIARIKPSIIHFYLPAAYLLGGVIAGLRGSNHLVMSRRSLNVYQSRYPVMARLERRLHRHMSAVLGNSRAVVGELESEGVPRTRLGLIYNGVNLAPLDRATSRLPGRQALGIDDATFVMVIVANLIPYKGHLDLLTALGGIRDRLPASWLLLCIGRDQEAIQDGLQREAERLGIADHVRFLGERWDVPDLLAAADLGLLCSHEEGFPNVILEYMAAGLPVVATDVGGSPEALVAEQTGLLVPARDPQALGAVILEMAADRERARSMGEAGRRVVEHRFSLQRCVTQYRSLYDALLAGSSLPVAAAIGVIDPREEARRHTVSVVIPVYNRAKTVLRAIASVLDQSYEVLEVLVVDDGSDDGTVAAVEALRDPRVRVIRHAGNLGAASARNTGIKAAQGSLIALLDSDDEWMPEKLEKQVRVITSSLSQDPAVVSGFVVHDAGRHWQVSLDRGYDVTRDRVWGCHVSPGSTLLTYRSCFDSVGLFDENLRRLEDWDWLIRFGEAHRMLVVPEPLIEVHFERQEIADQVAYALSYLEVKHGKQFARRSRWDFRKFRSSLAVERASLEYHRGQLAKAVLVILKAFTIYPFRNRVFFRTLARTALGALTPKFVR